MRAAHGQYSLADDGADTSAELSALMSGHTHLSWVGGFSPSCAQVCTGLGQAGAESSWHDFLTVVVRHPQVFSHTHTHTHSDGS